MKRGIKHASAAALKAYVAGHAERGVCESCKAEIVGGDCLFACASCRSKSAPASEPAAKSVVLVGCSGSKLDCPAPARELYTSLLFRKAVRYAEATGNEWAILSAKHGLVMPDDVLAPYDCSMKDLRLEGPGNSPKAAAGAWGARVAHALRTRWPGARFVFLAGQDYAVCLSGSWIPKGEKPLDAVEPLQGLGVGRRLAWLQAEADRLAPAVVHDENETEHAPCDFCGEVVEVAASELGDARFEGDDTPARICASCATWALEQLRGVPA